MQPWNEPEPFVRMDPLTRGSLFHKAQAEYLRALDRSGGLPISAGNLHAAIRTLHEVVDRVAAEYAELLVPAIDRVWRDEIDELRRDLGIWVRRLADDVEWIPKYFEFSFGLNDEGRDPRSLPDPVKIDSRFVLRGSVDLIEEHRDGSALRVTDHKTGRNRSTPDLVIGGGATLQPVLYSAAIEQGLGRNGVRPSLLRTTPEALPREVDPDRRGVTRAGSRSVDDRRSRDRAGPARGGSGEGRLPLVRLPSCLRTDEERRVASKPAALIADLHALRAMR